MMSMAEAFFELEPADYVVKPRLTLVAPKRKRRSRAGHGVDAKMLTRMIRAYGRRVGDADVEDLTELAEMRATLEEVIKTTVTHMHTHQEFSWSRIGEAFGITKQAAQQRYGR